MLAGLGKEGISFWALSLLQGVWFSWLTLNLLSLVPHCPACILQWTLSLVLWAFGI